MTHTFFQKEQHRPCHLVDSEEAATDGLIASWNSKEKIKTVAGALVLCLNVGVDPPDFIRISPCPTKQCWIDPITAPVPRALETIGKRLQTQYERWQPRAKYKLSLDPTVEQVRKVCNSLRRSAKGERVLFHYNGHGVPKPTNNGEIWVFNSHYTQYIPLSVYDLQCWLGNPVIYVLDCPSAGTFIDSILTSRSQAAAVSSSAASLLGQERDTMYGTILMGSCRRNESLDTHPDFPADLFTSCLTTPIKVALRFLLGRCLAEDGKVTPELLDSIPGLIHERKSPLGELHWIFTAVTDSIAWDILPSSLFQKLFRQDLLVASLFRNFLLAERIMSSMGVMPVTYPRLPPTYNHHLWQTWDVAAERILMQLPDLLIHKPPREFRQTSFFSDQLDAFALALKFGSSRKAPPQQLPVLLQVLLSPIHRVRALELLYEFMELGTWAVELSLSVGVFPYVLKLLQTTAVDLQRTLISIWAKLLTLDVSCQIDLCRDGGHQYFIHFLEKDDVDLSLKPKAAAALSLICHHYPQGQRMCIDSSLLGICAKLLISSAELEAELRSDIQKWICICIRSVCEGMPEAVPVVSRERLAEILLELTSDSNPEVRAAATAGLGIFAGIAHAQPESLYFDNALFDHLSGTSRKLAYDGSPIVRCETAGLLTQLILKPAHADTFEAAMVQIQRDAEAQANSIRRHVIPTSFPSAKIGILFSGEKSSPQREDIVRWTTHDAAQAQGSVFLAEHAATEAVASDSHRIILENLCLLAVDSIEKVSLMAVKALRLIRWDLDFWLKTESPKLSKQRDLHVKPLTQHGSLCARAEGVARMKSLSRASHEGRSWTNIARSAASSSVELAELQEDAEILHTRIELASRYCQRRPYRVKSLERRSLGKEPITGPVSSGSSTETALHDTTQTEADSPSLLLPSVIFSLARASLAEPRRPVILNRLSKTTSQLRLSTKGSKTDIGVVDKGKPVGLDSDLKDLTLSRTVLNVDTNVENIGAVLLDGNRDYVVVADRQGKIYVHDYSQPSYPEISSFSLTGLSGSNRTATQECIDTAALFCLDSSCSVDRLLACSTDGSVRVWDHCTDRDACALRSAWQAVPISTPPSFVLAPACFDWQPSTGYLFSASLSQPGVIHLFDVDQEKLIQQFGIDKNNVPAIDFLKCFRQSPNLLSVGAADGMVRVFDIRTHCFVCGVRAFNSQESISAMSPVITSRGEDLVVLSYSGNIKRLEICQSDDSVSSRLTTSASFKAHSLGCTSALVSHQSHPIMISATLHPVIKVWSPDGDQVSSIRPFRKHKENCQQAVTSLAYHPTDGCRFAAGGKGRICGIYSLVKRADEKTAGRQKD